MLITILIPTYNEANCIEEKLSNSRWLVEQCTPFAECKIIVADNGSTDGTRSLASGYDDVEVRDLGRIGKYESMRTIARETVSDWIILTDANVMVRDLNPEKLKSLLDDPSAAVLYGLVVRSKEATFPMLANSKPRRRLQLDEKFGMSSGANGAFYFVRGEPFAESFVDGLTIQNDDLYTAVLGCNKGRPRIAPILVEEVEDISFTKEFSRKHRDALGHFHGMLALARHSGKTQFAYVLGVRGSIWAGIICLELAVLFGLALNLYIVAPLLILFSLTTRGGGILGRCLGFTTGFIAGFFTAPQKIWDTDRS